MIIIYDLSHKNIQCYHFIYIPPITYECVCVYTHIFDADTTLFLQKFIIIYFHCLSSKAKLLRHKIFSEKEGEYIFKHCSNRQPSVQHMQIIFFRKINTM